MAKGLDPLALNNTGYHMASFAKLIEFGYPLVAFSSHKETHAMAIKKAVFVAAGRSSRLYPMTKDCPKPLLTLGEKRIIEHSIEAVNSIGVEQIVVVTGFLDKLMRQTLGDGVEYVFNPFYEHCNNMGSLWMAKEFVGQDPFIYLHSDLMYEPKILGEANETFSASTYSIQLLVDFKPTNEEAMKVVVDKKGMLVESSKEIGQSRADGEWTGIALIRDSESLFRRLEGDLRDFGLNHYDTFSFTKMAKEGSQIFCSPIGDRKWIEIDHLSDYEQAQRDFVSGTDH